MVKVLCHLQTRGGKILVCVQQPPRAESAYVLACSSVFRFNLYTKKCVCTIKKYTNLLLYIQTASPFDYLPTCKQSKKIFLFTYFTYSKGVQKPVLENVSSVVHIINTHEYKH